MNAERHGAYFYPLTVKDQQRRQRAAKLGYEPTNETELIQKATPFFEGHRQPRTHCLGTPDTTSWDDGDAKTMGRQVELAQDNGISFFVFDTYLGNRGGKPVQEMGAPLNESFLGLRTTRENFQFAVMMVFSSPRVIIPVPRKEGIRYEEPDRAFDLTPETARLMIDKCHEKYWSDPNYFFIKDRPYISLFTRSATDLVKLGNVIEELHTYATRRYGYDPYVVGVIEDIEEARPLVKAGLDALTGYALLPDRGVGVPPVQEYSEVFRKRQVEWPRFMSELKIPLIPPAVVGWDGTPRGDQSYNLEDVIGCYPYTPLVVGNSPEAFGEMLDATKEFVTNHVPRDEQYGIICAWNEVTESMALLPEVNKNGEVDFRFLEQVKRRTQK